jgi:1-pyrroline-5-carboxylate dehydrogenase
MAPLQTQTIRPDFENENTVWRLKQAGKLEEFDKKFEAAVARARKEFGRTYTHIIHGERKGGKGGTFPDTNPADTRQVLGYFAQGTRADVEKAIEAANAAYPAWSVLAYAERIKLIRRAAELLRERKYEFAAWMSLENGKNRIESMNDVDEAIDFLTYYPLVYEKNQGFVTKMYKPFPNEDCVSLLKPYGAWAVIAPFNFPVAITVGMTAGAILTGNTAVVKPASDTPLTAYMFVELLHEAGIPPGVVNYVTGPGGVVGQTLLDSPGIAGVVFTGSREVGLKGIEASAKRGRPFIAEMGGKNPVIVSQHADLEAAVEGVARSAFGFGGQKCSACSRVYVHESIKDEFTRRLVEWTKTNVTIGDPTKKETFLGPVITKRAHDQFLEYVAKAKKGGKVVHGGQSAAQGAMSHGHFVQPTIVDALHDDHWVTQNELFVPIVSLYTYKTLPEAIERANGVTYGLTAGIFTQDKKEQQLFFDTIQAGVTYCNRRIGGSTGAIVGGQSFVGWKGSGSSGRGAGGPWYLHQFLREQSQTRAG